MDERTSSCPPHLGTVVAGRYEIVDLLGAGGYGYVMRAHDRVAQGPVAVKFFDIEEDDLRRFEREVDAMRAVRHKNVVTILDVDLEHRPPFFVMPLAECTFEVWATKNRTQTMALLHRFLEVCEGLQALHAANHIHRDVKPSNMLVFGDRTVISDLGLARNLAREGSKLTRSTAVIGTEAYMAPEQRSRGGSHRANEQTDVYGLGRSLYELLTGLSPDLIDESVLDVAVAPIVTKAAAEHPSKRYASVAEFADAVRGYQSVIDPNSGAEERLDATIASATQRLAAGSQYRKDEVRQIMQLWLGIRENDLALDKWDDIPMRLMPAMVQVDAHLTERILQRLRAVFHTDLTRRPWAYAEDVASRMRGVVSVGPPPSLHAAALRLVLMAAVSMHRYAAMDAFNAMLKDTASKPAVAASVAEMLREEIDDYRAVAEQVQPHHLHVAIRDVRAAAIARGKMT